MRIQVLSDLHLEMYGDVRLPDPSADVVVLAGDIGAGADGVVWAAQRWTDRPVVYVIGNHEYYGGDVDAVLAACREAASGTTVQVLERESVDIDGVRFLGTTLWTDFDLFGEAFAAESRAAAERDMPDFRLIEHNHAPLTPADTVAWHRRARSWLRGELAREPGSPNVVVTHHAPLPRSNHYGPDVMAPAFVSDLSDLIGQHRPTLWVHGHTHTSEDYRAGVTRVVANQAGYTHEDTRWAPEWLIDVAV